MDDIKNTLKEFIECNLDKEYVIFIHTKDHFEVLRDILVTLEFYPTIQLDSLENMMNTYVDDNNYECGLRISKRRGIAWNHESIEWWIQKYFDIIEVCTDGSIKYHGDISQCPFSGMIPVVIDGAVIGYYFYNINDIKENKNNE